ncbi:hypothetical protein IWW55_000856 [Coemansia sp. RSA 2706]|nr:hypothetical protein IWW55_000856 [Coemansia sp. RSA 2706]
MRRGFCVRSSIDGRGHSSCARLPVICHLLSRYLFATIELTAAHMHFRRFAGVH